VTVEHIPADERLSAASERLRLANEELNAAEREHRLAATEVETREQQIRQEAYATKRNAFLRSVVAELQKTLQCNCDLDNWEPERSTGHSHVCRIHKVAIARPMP
jgi:hypothetical protein